MNIQSAYNDWSVSYDTDQNRTRDLDYEVIRKTLSGRRYRSILEMGSGTGKNTSFLAEIGARIAALDFSSGMQQKAQEKSPPDHVAFIRADLTKPWPCASQCADLIVCSLVLEHVENLQFIFSEAARTLKPGGQFFVCELHPFRQYQGKKARFQRDQETTRIDAYVHHISDYLLAAPSGVLSLENLQEWWHADDQGKPPRLVSFLFKK